MYALTFSVTYILLAFIPGIALWLSFLGNKYLSIGGLVMGGISAFLAFVGLYALVNDLLGGRSLGETTGAVIFSSTLMVIFFGGFLVLTAIGIFRNYAEIFGEEAGYIED
jgi:hypothetical protein